MPIDRGEVNSLRFFLNASGCAVMTVNAKSWTTLLTCLPLLLVLFIPASSNAEDADRLRPYFRFGNGDIAANWGVTDHWSLALGANLDRHWGGELGIDNFERDYKYQGGNLGSISAWHVVPQLRLRQPLIKDRLVPYLIGGAGVSFLEFKDEEAREAVLGRQVSINGATFTMSGGGGVDYFVADSVAFNFEGKYFWLQPLSGKVDGAAVDADLSSTTFTVGLCVYTDLNRPRPLADAEPRSHGRGYIGARLGGAVLTDARLTRETRLGSDTPSLGAVNQTGGLLFGWDFDRNWGAELAWDFLEFRPELDGQVIGEYALKMVIPQLRYRIPLDGGSWVPYLNAGVGASFSEFNDRKAAGYGLKIDAQGFHPVASAGAGIEYFVHRDLSVLADLGWIYAWDQQFGVGSATEERGDSSVFVFRVGVRAYLFD